MRSQSAEVELFAASVEVSAKGIGPRAERQLSRPVIKIACRGRTPGDNLLPVYAAAL